MSDYTNTHTHTRTEKPAEYLLYRFYRVSITEIMFCPHIVRGLHNMTVSMDSSPQKHNYQNIHTYTHTQSGSEQ